MFRKANLHDQDMYGSIYKGEGKKFERGERVAGPNIGLFQNLFN